MENDVTQCFPIIVLNLEEGDIAIKPPSFRSLKGATVL